MDARRSRPARSSTSLFDQLGDTSSTGTLQASSAQRIPRRAAALLEKMGCCSRGPWSAFPWSWRPPRSSTGKTKVVGLVELSMPAPLHYAHYDGITMHYLALCDPPTGGPTYCRPLSGCRLPEMGPYLLTYLLSHSRGTPLSHPHCPVGQLRSRVVGPEYAYYERTGRPPCCTEKRR